MNHALILIDYTCDFVAHDGKLTAGVPAQAIDENLAAAIGETIEAGGMVFVVNDLHLENDGSHPETALFPPHNLLGSPGRAVYGKTAEKLQAYQMLENRQVFYMDKFRYSAFVGTALDILLRQNHIQKLELAGVCTDISAYNLGYEVTVHKNRVASFNAEGHKWALEHFKSSLGFTVV